MAQKASRPPPIRSIEDVAVVLHQWGCACDGPEVFAFRTIGDDYRLNEIAQFLAERIFPTTETAKTNNKKKSSSKSQQQPEVPITFFKPEDVAIILKLIHAMEDSSIISPDSDIIQQETIDFMGKLMQHLVIIFLVGVDWKSMRNAEGMTQFFVTNGLSSILPFYGLTTICRFWQTKFENLKYEHAQPSRVQLEAAESIMYALSFWLAIQLKSTIDENELEFDDADLILNMAYQFIGIRGDSSYLIVDIIYLLVIASTSKTNLLRSEAWYGRNRRAFYRAAIGRKDQMKQLKQFPFSTMDFLLQTIGQRLPFESDTMKKCSIAVDILDIIWTLSSFDNSSTSEMKFPPFFSDMSNVTACVDMPIGADKLTLMFDILCRVPCSMTSAPFSSASADTLEVFLNTLKKCKDIEFLGSHGRELLSSIMKLLAKLSLTKVVPVDFETAFWGNSKLLESILELIHIYRHTEDLLSSVLFATWNFLFLPISNAHPQLLTDPIFADICFLCLEIDMKADLMDVMKILSENFKSICKVQHEKVMEISKSKAISYQLLEIHEKWISILIPKIQEHKDTNNQSLWFVEYSCKILSALNSEFNVGHHNRENFYRIGIELLEFYQPHVLMMASTVVVVYDFICETVDNILERKPQIDMELEKKLVALSFKYLSSLPWRKYTDHSRVVSIVIASIFNVLDLYDLDYYYSEDSRVYLEIFIQMLKHFHLLPMKSLKSVMSEVHVMNASLVKILLSFIEHDFLIDPVPDTMQQLNADRIDLGQQKRWQILFQLDNKFHELLVDILCQYHKAEEGAPYELVLYLLALIMRYLDNYMQPNEVDERFARYPRYQFALTHILLETSDDGMSEYGEYLPDLFAELARSYYIFSKTNQSISENQWNEFVTFIPQFLKVIAGMCKDGYDEYLIQTVDVIYWCNKKVEEFDGRNLQQEWIKTLLKSPQLFFDLIVMIFRRTKQQALYFEKICEVLYRMQLTVRDVDMFTSANGSCDLLIQALRYHKKEHSLVHLVCQLLLHLCDQSEAAMKKLGNVANCFEILLMTCKEQAQSPQELSSSPLKAVVNHPVQVPAESTHMIVQKLFQRLVVSNRNKSKQLSKDSKGMEILVNTFLQFAKTTTEGDERNPPSFVTTVCCLLSDLCLEDLKKGCFSKLPVFEYDEAKDGGDFVNAAIYIFRHYHQNNLDLVLAIILLVEAVSTAKNSAPMKYSFFLKSFDVIFDILSTVSQCHSKNHVEMIKMTCKLLATMHMNSISVVQPYFQKKERCVDILFQILTHPDMISDMNTVYCIFSSLLMILRAVPKFIKRFNNARWMFEVLNQVEERHCDKGVWKEKGYEDDFVCTLLSTIAGDAGNIKHILKYPSLLLAALRDISHCDQNAKMFAEYIRANRDVQAIFNLAKAPDSLHNRLQYAFAQKRENMDEKLGGALLALLDTHVMYQSTLTSEFFSRVISNYWRSAYQIAMFMEVKFKASKALTAGPPHFSDVREMIWYSIPYAVISNLLFIQIQTEPEPALQNIRAVFQQFILSQIQQFLRSGPAFKLICSSCIAIIELYEYGVQEKLAIRLKATESWIEYFMPERVLQLWIGVMSFYTDYDMANSLQPIDYGALVKLFQFLRSMLSYGNHNCLQPRLGTLIRLMASTHIASHIDKKWLHREELVEYACGVLRLLQDYTKMTENDSLLSLEWEKAVSVLQVFGSSGNLSIVDDCCNMLLFYLENSSLSQSVLLDIFNSSITWSNLFELLAELLEKYHQDDELLVVLLKSLTKFFKISATAKYGSLEKISGQKVERCLSFCFCLICKYRACLRDDLALCHIEKMKPLLNILLEGYRYAMKHEAFVSLACVQQIPHELMDAIASLLATQLHSVRWQRYAEKSMTGLYFNCINDTIHCFFDFLIRCIDYCGDRRISWTQKTAFCDILLQIFKYCNEHPPMDSTINLVTTFDVIRTTCKSLLELFDRSTASTSFPPYDGSIDELISLAGRKDMVKILMDSIRCMVISSASSSTMPDKKSRVQAMNAVLQLLVRLLDLSDEHAKFVWDFPSILTRNDNLALLSEVSSIFGGCEDINRYVAVLFGNIMSHTCHQNVSEEVDEFSLNTIGTRLRSLASNVLYIFQQQSQGKGVTMTKQSDMTDVMKLFNLSMRAENPVEDRHADDREILDCAIHMLRQHGVYSEAICCDCCELLDMLLVVDDSNLASPLLLDRDRGQSLCKSLMELLITINKDHQCKPSYRKAVLKMLTILQTCLPEILEPIAFCGETDPITSVVEAEYWLNRSTNLLKLVLLQSKEDAELVPRLLHVVHEVNIHTMCIVKPSCHPDGKLVIGELLELIQKQGNPQSVSKISRRSRADGFINVKQDVQQQETKVLLMLKVFQTFTVWIVTQDLADVTNLFLQSDERNIFWQLLSSYPENEFIVCTICDIFLNMLMSLEKTDQHGIGKSKFWSMWLQSLLQFLKRHKSSVAVSTSILKLMSHILQDLAKAEWSTEEMEFYCNPQTIIILFLALKSHSLHQKDIIICCLSCIHHLLSTSNLMSKEPHLSAFQRNYLVDILKYYDRLDGRVSEEVKCILAIVGSDECEESSGDQVSSKNEVTKSNTQSLSPTLPIPSKAAIASNEIEIISPIDSKVYKGKWRETQVAIKLQSANGDKIQAEEFEMLSSSRHPRLLSVYGRCESLPTSILTSVSGGIVMEYMDKGDLRSLLNSEQGFASLTIEKMLRIAVDISEGMNFLHASNMIHRCLKTCHILLDEHYRAKISGFGEERTNELDKSPNKFLFTFKNRCIDVYDFGVILWELLTGKVPWEAKTMKQGKLTLTGKETKDSPAKLVTLMNHCMDCVASTSISKTNSTMSSSISGTESLTFKEIHMVLQDLLQDEIKQMEDRQRAVPDGFICPITQDIMKDPVMLVGDGHSYERKAILEWLQRTNRSPLTNEVLPAVNVTSTNTNAPSTSGGTANTLVVMENYALKSSIQSFLANQQLLHR